LVKLRNADPATLAARIMANAASLFRFDHRAA
jgi:hypothetical protein